MTYHSVKRICLICEILINHLKKFMFVKYQTFFRQFTLFYSPSIQNMLECLCKKALT